MKTDLPNRTNKTLKKLKMPRVLSDEVCFTFQQTGEMRQFLAQFLRLRAKHEITGNGETA